MTTTPMTSSPLFFADSATMLRRNLRRMRRYPSLTFFIAGIPVVLLLLFVYVFGGALGAGLGQVSGGRAAYTAYVLPGILLITVAGAGQGTAISVAMDMTEGIIARFKTMAVSRSSVLVGHVVGSVIQTMLALLIVVLVALLIGFRPTTGPVEWVAAAGLLVLAAVAITWLSVAMGLVSDSVETASNLPMFLILLPFLGSGFVPTDSMPDGLAWFAANQPFTPVMETLRGLLFGTAIGDSGVLAVAWCIALSPWGISGRGGSTTASERARGSAGQARFGAARAHRVRRRSMTGGRWRGPAGRVWRRPCGAFPAAPAPRRVAPKATMSPVRHSDWTSRAGIGRSVARGATKSPVRHPEGPFLGIHRPIRGASRHDVARMSQQRSRMGEVVVSRATPHPQANSAGPSRS